MAEFRERRLDHTTFPYVFLNATYVKAHEGTHVVSKAIVVATGVAADGNREVLGLAVGDLIGVGHLVDEALYPADVPGAVASEVLG